MSFSNTVRDEQMKNHSGLIISHLRFSTFILFYFIFSLTMLISNIWMLVLAI